jgi:hypothetical protein
MLSSEFPPSKTPVTQPVPDDRFGGRQMLSQVTGATNGSGTLLVHDGTLPLTPNKGC